MWIKQCKKKKKQRRPLMRFKLDFFEMHQLNEDKRVLVNITNHWDETKTKFNIKTLYSRKLLINR